MNIRFTTQPGEDQIRAFAEIADSRFPTPPNVVRDRILRYTRTRPGFNVGIVESQGRVLGGICTQSVAYSQGRSSKRGIILSLMATRPLGRDSTASQLMVRFAEGLRDAFDVVLGYPRKVMQGYWSRYGFLESTLHFPRFQMGNIQISGSPIVWRPLPAKDCLTEMGDLYVLHSDPQAFVPERSGRGWAYIASELEMCGGQAWIAADEKGREIGYALETGGRILELAIDSDWRMNLGMRHVIGRLPLKVICGNASAMISPIDSDFFSSSKQGVHGSSDINVLTSRELRSSRGTITPYGSLPSGRVEETPATELLHLELSRA